MKNLEEISEQYATEEGYFCFGEMRNRGMTFNDVRVIAERYKKQAVHKALDEAAEEIERRFSDDEIEESGKEGGLMDNELQMFFEGAAEYRGKARKSILKLKEKY